MLKKSFKNGILSDRPLNLEVPVLGAAAAGMWGIGMMAVGEKSREVGTYNQVSSIWENYRVPVGPSQGQGKRTISLQALALRKYGEPQGNRGDQVRIKINCDHHHLPAKKVLRCCIVVQLCCCAALSCPAAPCCAVVL